MISKNIHLLIIMLLAIIVSVLPHTPNFSPMIVFALYLGTRTTKFFSIGYILCMALISGIILHMTMHYPIWGDWAIFTYSALLMIGMAGSILKKHLQGTSFIAASALIALGYWLWTNLGVWWLSGMYAHSFVGLQLCYITAIPFLQTSLASSLLWGVILEEFPYSVSLIRATAQRTI